MINGSELLLVGIPNEKTYASQSEDSIATCSNRTNRTDMSPGSKLGAANSVLSPGKNQSKRKR